MPQGDIVWHVWFLSATSTGICVFSWNGAMNWELIQTKANNASIHLRKNTLVYFTV